MANPVIVVGAQVVPYINGVPCGRVVSVSWAPSTPSREIRGIDEVRAVELAPTTSSCSGSVMVYKTLRDGGAEGLGVSPPTPKLVRGKYFSLALVDRLTDTTIFEAHRCTVEGQSWHTEPKKFVLYSFTFKALDWS